jgi:hypothetical protein
MNNTQHSDRFGGMTIAGFLAVLYGILILVFAVDVRAILIAAILVFAVALVVPAILLPLNRLWTKLTKTLATLNNFLILGLFFVLFVLPMGLCLRIIGRDPMHRKPRRDGTSYWTVVQRNTDSSTLRDMF